MSKHTPGPWSVDPADPLRVVADGGARLVATCPVDPLYLDNPSEREIAIADARLTASAPDLADALAFTWEVIRLLPRERIPFELNPRFWDAENDAAEALRKAGRAS